jgi:tRNA(fMet)-specific endonuclease VapC
LDITKLCIDTNGLIAFLKEREPGASAVEKAVRNYDCCVTAITVYELLFGVARARKYIGEDDLLGMMRVIPFDEASARRAANLHDALIRQNQDIGIKDVLIAAICLEWSLPLLTLNDRHFSRVPELQVVTPDQLLV